MTETEYLNYIKTKNNYKISENLFKCPICYKEFSNKGFINHIKKEHFNKENGINNHGKNNSYQLAEYKNKIRDAIDKRLGKIVLKERKCEKCGKSFYVEEREKLNSNKQRFCSSTCAHSRILTEETRKKISDSMKEKMKDEEYREKLFEKFIDVSLQTKYFTSLNECLIREYFMQNFKDDEWTFGGGIKYRNQRVSRDLYSDKLKICFEYDGIWHFKDIHNQLKDKQYKDWCLEQWCRENNYRLIRISESWFIENKKDILKIVDLIYENKEQIIKIGKEYTENYNI